ncbi:A/G-specific adenine glycosylase [Virgibacillus salexigens]|uniref:Adenine DNA glycosylase n=1 Tax=Virgibacillus massiliensis TaxID=1462526 RepID=A0A024QIS5_9BACI|nr:MULTISPECIES: A/G-specific adenine glycosylase [Virgibacillus]MYL43002.1 A/G-specific adenine glycosylase [Virgibacillus massiliensis]CDQ42090.1 putative A/G-specific adenine glycosylase YfhQ [Virgibacillus massiliensis]
MIDKKLQYIDISRFQNDLITWYQENKRDLPWRQDQDPYKIWVSEIMLQQTKVDTVIPYFQRFIKKYPDVHALAQADPEDVLKSWEGLGYYSRARNLQNAVREVVATYNGEVPDNGDELGALKGVGAYTKGAILSIAFNQPEPAVDGNVMRVFSRILRIEEDIALQRTKKLFESYVRELIDESDPSSFNQAVMELGALICTPKSPACLLCPVQEHCQAFAAGVEEELPIKKKAKKQKKVPYVVLLVKNKQEQYIIEKRSDKGLLANLWQFPMVPINEIGWDHLENWVYHEYGIHLTLGEKQANLKHVFSHLIWQLDVYEAKLEQPNMNERLKLVEKKALTNYPFPVSHQKIMSYIK